MKKILFILGMYQPRPSANGICCEQVIKELINNGYDVTCIVNGRMNSPGVEIYEGVKIYRVKTRLTYRLFEWVEFNNPSQLACVVHLMACIMNKLKNFFFFPLWPFVSPAYSYRFYEKAKEQYIKQKFDLVVAVYSPIDSLIAGHLLKKKFSEIKFVPYFLDSLSGGYGPRIFSKKRIIKVGQAWEKRLLQNADRIVAMKSSEGHHRQYNIANNWFDRIVFLDIPLIAEKKLFIGKTELLNNSKINMVYMGSIPYPIRNPDFILRAIEHLKRDDIVLTFVGTNTCPEIFKISQERLGRRLNIIDRVSHEDAISIMHEANILINIGNNNSSMVPSKLFEYMALGKPIISTYPIDDEPCITYLKKYPAALLIDEREKNKQKIAEQIEVFIQKYKDHQVKFETVKSILYNNTPEAFVKVINYLVQQEDLPDGELFYRGK